MIDTQKLESTAKALVAQGKGILAADESNGTCNKRFESVGAPTTEDSRRAYRELLFTTPESKQFLSGVILYDETIRQSASNGMPFAQMLAGAGIIPGIKVDKGTVALPNSPEEKMTEGLDGLRQRLAEYVAMGAGFTKWRSVITIGENMPTDACVRANADTLAMYALLAQEAGLVPIIEPEVILDGTHGIARAESVTQKTLETVFASMASYGVYLPGLILKTSMVVPGKGSGETMVATDVAERTARVLKSVVPSECGGVVFLSGGQTPAQAAENLSEITKRGPYPWGVTFSYARALQEPALAAWAGKNENVSAAQTAFAKRLTLAGAALSGTYATSME